MRDRSLRHDRQAHQPIAPAMTARRIKEKVQKTTCGTSEPSRPFLAARRTPPRARIFFAFRCLLAQLPIGVATINAAMPALRFFFNVTLERPDLVRPLTTVNTPRRAPVVLSQEEVARLLEAAPGLKYKTALSVAYGAGLRVSEVEALNVRPRQPAYDASGRARQGAAGPLCDALAATARTVARLVARGAASGLAGLSHCGAAGAKHRRLRNCQAAASAVRHVSIAAARSTRCVWAEMR